MWRSLLCGGVICWDGVHGAAYRHCLAEMYSAPVRCDGRFFLASDEVTYVLSAAAQGRPTLMHNRRDMYIQGSKTCIKEGKTSIKEQVVKVGYGFHQNVSCICSVRFWVRDTSFLWPEPPPDITCITIIYNTDAALSEGRQVCI